MKTVSALSMKPVSTSLQLTKPVCGRNVKTVLPGLPAKIYAQLYEASEKMRKLSTDKQLSAGVELLVVIYEIAEMLEAVQLAIQGVLELRTRREE